MGKRQVTHCASWTVLKSADNKGDFAFTCVKRNGETNEKNKFL